MSATDATADGKLGAQLAAMCAEASAFILPLWRSELLVSHKADESPVTEADRGAEALLLRALAAAFPDIPVVSEEDSSEFGTPEAIGPRFFLVDPLDGTKAFVAGRPHFTVNIGLVVDGAPVAGAVAAPALNEVWFTTGEGAAKALMADGALAGPGVPIRARREPADGPVCIASHTLSSSAEAGLRARYGFTAVERVDSSLKLCRIAEGAADLYPRHGPTMEWDIAAAHAVLLAAGGRLTTPEGAPFRYGKADKRFLNGDFVARGAA